MAPCPPAWVVQTRDLRRNLENLRDGSRNELFRAKKNAWHRLRLAPGLTKPARRLFRFASSPGLVPALSRKGNQPEFTGAGIRLLNLRDRAVSLP